MALAIGIILGCCALGAGIAMIAGIGPGIGEGNDSIIERSRNVGNAQRNVLLFLLFDCTFGSSHLALPWS